MSGKLHLVGGQKIGEHKRAIADAMTSLGLLPVLAIISELCQEEQAAAIQLHHPQEALNLGMAATVLHDVIDQLRPIMHQR